MTMGWVVGEVEWPCKVCRTVIRHEGVRSDGLVSAFWLADPHVAPCGLDCMGGGLATRESRQALRDGNVHGRHGCGGRSCPRCGDVSEGPACPKESRG